MRFSIHKVNVGATRKDPLGGERYDTITLEPEDLGDAETLHNLAALGDADIRVSTHMHPTFHDVVVSYQVHIGATNSSGRASAQTQKEAQQG